MVDTAAVEEDTVVGMVYEEVAGMEDKVLVHILLLYNLVQESSFIIEYVEKKKKLGGEGSECWYGFSNVTRIGKGNYA